MHTIAIETYAPKHADVGHGEPGAVLGVIMMQNDREFLVAEFSAGPGRFARFNGHYTDESDVAENRYVEKVRRYRHMEYRIARLPDDFFGNVC